MITLFIVFFLRLTVVMGTQVAMYKERTSGKCGDSGGGWGKITSAAACGAGAAALGWGDTTAYTWSISTHPPGCYYYYPSLMYNTADTNIACSSNKKCICTLVCPPGTYQDQTGQSTCKECQKKKTGLQLQQRYARKHPRLCMRQFFMFIRQTVLRCQ